MNEKNHDALKAYCDVLLALRDMQDQQYRGVRKKREKLPPRVSVINRMISHAIRNATDSAHPFGYSDSGKNATQWISVAAQMQLEEGNPSGLICEHVIPIGELEAHIRTHWDTDNWGPTDLISCFKQYSVTAIITEKEDKSLNGVLRHSMPSGRSIEDKFSRYGAAKIIHNPTDLIERDGAMQKRHKKLFKSKRDLD